MYKILDNMDEMPENLEANLSLVNVAYVLPTCVETPPERAHKYERVKRPRLREYNGRCSYHLQLHGVRPETLESMTY